MIDARGFWAFVRERHAIYVRRFVEKKPPPWTTDQVLANYHFTNVYREHDPGTVFIRHALNAHVLAALPEKILNVAMYRLCLHEDSFERIGWAAFSGFSGEAWGARVGEDPRPFHGAYYIHNLGLRVPKHVAMGIVAGHVAEFLRAGGPPEGNRREWLEALAAVKGLGGFIATQALADLAYDQHVALPADGYVMLGPGAMRGLALVAGREDLQEPDAQDTLAYLHERQAREFDGHLTMMNLQNCCCEFGKYKKGKARRRFDAASRGATQESLFAGED